MSETGHNRRFKPLAEDAIEEFDRAASKETNNTLSEIVSRTLLHTGMRNGELCHMRPSWIENLEGRSVIRVPKKEECIGGVGEAGFQNQDGRDLHERGHPCSKCRGAEHREDDMWTAKTKNTPRTIPIMEDEVIDILSWWFERNEQIPLLHNSVVERVNQVADFAGLDRRVLAHDLRHTYGTMLARMDFTALEIKTAMGHGSIDTSQKYIEYTGVRKVRTFEEKWDLEF